MAVPCGSGTKRTPDSSVPITPRVYVKSVSSGDNEATLSIYRINLLIVKNCLSYWCISVLEY